MDKFNKLIIFFLFIIKSCSDPSQESRIFSKNEEVKANSLSDNIKTKKHSLYSVILNTNNSISMTTREYLFDILKVNGTDQYQSDIDMGIDNFSKSAKNPIDNNFLRKNLMKSLKIRNLNKNIKVLRKKLI